MWCISVEIDPVVCFQNDERGRHTQFNPALQALQGEAARNLVRRNFRASRYDEPDGLELFGLDDGCCMAILQAFASGPKIDNLPGFA